MSDSAHSQTSRNLACCSAGNLYIHVSRLHYVHMTWTVWAGNLACLPKLLTKMVSSLGRRYIFLPAQTVHTWTVWAVNSLGLYIRSRYACIGQYRSFSGKQFHLQVKLLADTAALHQTIDIDSSIISIKTKTHSWFIYM